MTKKLCIQIRALKKALNHVSLLKKHSVIQFDQKLWLKPYIDMETKLKTELMVLEMIFFKLLNNSVLERQWKM